MVEIVKCDTAGYNVVKDGKFAVWVESEERAQDVAWLLAQ